MGIGYEVGSWYEVGGIRVAGFCVAAGSRERFGMLEKGNEVSSNIT
jgi:hypothetical protein